MKTVQKFDLSTTPRTQILSLPLNSELLSVSFEDNYLCLYAAVDTENRNGQMSIAIFTPNQEMPELEDYKEYSFIDFAYHRNGSIVHVFEIIDTFPF